jgi:hypothetical protein
MERNTSSSHEWHREETDDWHSPRRIHEKSMGCQILQRCKGDTTSYSLGGLKRTIVMEIRADTRQEIREDSGFSTS